MIINETLPYLTAAHLGLGGRIKETPSDFEVEEIPAYDPSGEGEHLYLWVEKTDMGAEFFSRQIARRLNIPPGDIGTAGLKDRRAVTRQWVSVPVKAETGLPGLEGEGIRVLKVTRHGNKLRAGHLRGNRFRVLIRGASQDVPLAPVLDAIRQNGLPNFYGSQRFGRNGETLALGWNMLMGQSVKVRNPFMKKLTLSAAQSYLFNRVLTKRMSDGLFRTVLAGDVLAKWPAGGMFTNTDVSADQPRFDAREVVHAGPMFGKKTFPTTGVAAEREQAVLTESGVPTEAFDKFGQLLSGTRRHNLVYVEDLAAEWEPEGLRLTFTLPAGSYATVLLGEVMKSEVAGDDSPDAVDG
ncbi:tRNA pseudouridine(13) synthase TruD [Zavarzinella formosa]|uniref:tRNA pseudouridine(13) synthase TruD n=1 Tax=Zavarzinella formosa TaxID=360055 RepID=UPI0002EF2B5E|nr:tRNA pseudouridine(13) synthase TruD [Zavarzinella formosa]